MRELRQHLSHETPFSVLQHVGNSCFFANVSPKTPTKCYRLKVSECCLICNVNLTANSSYYRTTDVFEVETWLHNKPANIDNSLVNGQRFDSRLPCANSKPVLNLSKAVFFKLFVPGSGQRRSKNRAVANRGSSRLSPRRKSKEPLSRRAYKTRLLLSFCNWTGFWAIAKNALSHCRSTLKGQKALKKTH